MTAHDRAESEREILSRREAVVSSYPERWRGMIRKWSMPRRDDAVWLMYSANYLFNAHGLKWAVDPVLLANRIPEAPAVDASRDLNDTKFVLLTHNHADHVDPGLWTRLKSTHCRWIVPEHMVGFFVEQGSMRESDHIVAVPGRTIDVEGARITPFDSPHIERNSAGRLTGVPSTGYLVETGGESYLFPCDVRTYDPMYLTPFAGVSAVFAHVFLGRSAALELQPPLLDAFLEFYLNARPRKIVLTHLYELGRAPEDCWLRSHAEDLARAFTAADKDVTVVIPEWHEETIL